MGRSMSAAELMAKLRSAGIRLQVSGNKLRYSPPLGGFAGDEAPAGSKKVRASILLSLRFPPAHISE
jgi:hypothetical protein